MVNWKPDATLSKLIESKNADVVQNMNPYTLLYYPGFHPDTLWLRRVLLLADNLTRIVPTDVETSDPENLLALQESVPGCLRSISPEAPDVAIEEHDMPRLAQAFAFLARSQPKRSQKGVAIEMVISKTGSLSVLGHVFLHHAKVSPAIREELRRNRLIVDGFEGLVDGFVVVDRNASSLILSNIAENISRRIGSDAITDEPVPFALNALNNLGVKRATVPGAAEGALLSSLASVLIPLDVATLSPRDYRDLRDAYASIRTAFKELTAELARINRLNHIQDPKFLRHHVKITAAEFFKEYQAFRKSRYARGFREWTPLYVGGLLSMVMTVVAPPVALGIAGVSLGIQVIQKRLDGPTGPVGRERIFNMLAGIRKDVIRRTGVKQII